jgi:hypothetical protein
VQPRSSSTRRPAPRACAARRCSGKPTAIPLADICKIAVTPAFDRSCGFATCYTLLVSRSGNHLELPPAAKASAEEAAQAIRDFLGLEEGR